MSDYDWSPEPPQEPNPQGSNRGVIIAGVAVVAVLVALVAGGAVFFFANQRNSADAARETVYTTTTVPAEETSASESAPSPEPSATPPQPQESRTFDSYRAATDMTSDPFAASVGEAFKSYWQTTGNTSGTIRTYSPVTGLYYDMQCSDNGTVVRCLGGNNGVVLIQ